MNASEISQMLRDRHKDDLWVSECKDGGTWNRSHVRLDGWAMEKSWTRPRMIGYEIKVSRSDFLQDNKWPEYLPLCNELYFVCPAKLIQPEELPTHVGLIWAGGRLVTKRKAAYRQITPPVELMKYILMCRSTIGREVQPGDSREHKLDKWRRWLAEKKTSNDLGYDIRRKVREIVDAVKAENRGLKEENQRLQGVKEQLKLYGLSPNSHGWQVSNMAERKKVVFSHYEIQLVDNAMDRLQMLKKAMEDANEAKGV